MSVFDAEPYLRNSIESILCQSFGDFEFLIISEHETSEESIRIVKSFSDKRIRHIHNVIRLGFAQSLNKALRQARGQYVALMDADDISKRQRLEREVQFLDAHPDVGIVGTWSEVIDESGRTLSKECGPIDPALIKWRLLYSNVITHSSTMVRRTIHEALGYYDTKIPYAEDYEFWTRAALITELANIPEVLFCHRIHRGSAGHMHVQSVFETAVLISRNTIATRLGERVPTDVLGVLVQPSSLIKPGDALRAAKLLRRLCLRYICLTPISHHQENVIRLEVAQRILTLSSVCARRNGLISLRILSLIPKLCREQSFGPFALATLERGNRMLYRRLQRMLIKAPHE
jgi:glycosyltransferase involved in cell wall biosynthesis